MISKQSMDSFFKYQQTVLVDIMSNKVSLVIHLKQGKRISELTYKVSVKRCKGILVSVY